ncbi:MAG: hypothetical protein K2N72_12500, partial [Oscillospiraceae bacterium]|nr:hypothetical protein [Oscillospiraceae bacterium]
LNISAYTVTLHDPMKGIIDYNIDKFEVRFKEMHSQAIVLIPDNNVPVVTEAVTNVPESVFEYEETIASPEAVTESYTETVTEAVTETLSPWGTSEQSVSSEITFPGFTEYDDSTDFYTGEFYSE